jgi:glyoxylase-like metal-dependent hydrolase (beta-lactamase superfamily II)
MDGSSRARAGLAWFHWGEGMAELADCGRPVLAVTMTDESFRLHVLPAGNGDALVLEYGSGHDRQRILVDGGIPRAAARVKAFLGDDPELELLVVTHIDNDHIGGLLRLLEMRAPPRPAEVWFNGYRHLPKSDPRARIPVERGFQAAGGEAR